MQRILSGTYIYLEIASSLKGRIEQGDFHNGRLPSERDLTAEFGVQRATIRRALKTLEEQGLVFRDATRGTFARPGSTPPRTEHGGLALVIGRAHDTTAPADIARGLAAAAREAERFLLWVDTPSAPGHAEAQVPDPRELMGRGVAATVLWPEIPAPVARLRALRDAMPLVLLDRRVPGFESDFVGIDDFAAGKQITRHLLSAGHRRIGFASVAPHVGTVQERYRGYAAALREAGLSPRSDWALHREGDLSGRDDSAIQAMLAGGGESPTALVGANDSVAAALYCTLRRLGRRVPDDVALTGFGNSMPTLLDALGLTTVAQPFAEMGRAAGEMAQERLRRRGGTGEAPHSFQEALLPIEIVVRSSCGGSPAVSAAATTSPTPNE